VTLLNSEMCCINSITVTHSMLVLVNHGNHYCLIFDHWNDCFFFTYTPQLFENVLRPVKKLALQITDVTILSYPELFTNHT